MAKLLSNIKKIRGRNRYRTTDGCLHTSSIAANSRQSDLDRVRKAKAILNTVGAMTPSSDYAVSVGRLVALLRHNPAEAKKFAKLIGA
jgi:N-glycosylase/DNA lyase